MPMDVVLPSVKARAGLWQVAQATVPLAERRASKKSFCPNAALAGMREFGGEMTHLGKTPGKAARIYERGSTHGPTTGLGGGRPGARARGRATPGVFTANRAG